MSNTLFPNLKSFDYLLDLEYKGPSFDGMMEIGALKNEIAGLEEALKITARVLAKNKKIDFSPDDLQIFIEAFEKASFRKKVKIVLKSLKSLNNYQGAINLGILLVAILTLVQQKGASEIKNISPQLAMEIGDQVKIELLQDKNYLKSIADIVAPLEVNGDKLFCSVPEYENAEITYENKKEFIELSDPSQENVEINGDRFETLRGRINRVDLDATIRHLGFKVTGEGSSIYATLSDQLRASTDMRSLLGQWVEMEATTTYKNGLRDHIAIRSLKIIQQQQIEFNESKQEVK